MAHLVLFTHHDVTTQPARFVPFHQRNELIHIGYPRPDEDKAPCLDRAAQRQPGGQPAAHREAAQYNTRFVNTVFLPQHSQVALDFPLGPLPIIPDVGVWPHHLGGTR